MTKGALQGKPDEGNPCVRFDEGKGASEKPVCAPLLRRLRVIAAAVVAGGCFFALDAETHDYPIRNADFASARATGGFWLDRIETNRVSTLVADWAKCEETPRIANITNAAERALGTFRGIPFDDSDVYKVMEGTAYILAQHPDPELAKKLEWLIGKIAWAQEPDGYLYTARTLCFMLPTEDKDGWSTGIMGPVRWCNLCNSHELYNQGHMIEAAVARFETSGNADFLEIARRSADLMCRTFGYEPTQLKLTSGHQEIELALAKLYRVTGEKKYLDLAKFFLDMRGRKDIRWTWGADRQDHEPVVEQKTAIGHAVRAGYMYCGMADVAALTGDKSYQEAIDRIWEDVVGGQLYLTGGVGARRSFRHPLYGGMCEAFNGSYDLPNDSGESYLETCAAIANMLWNDRMFRAKGDAKYIDVLERTLYNGFLSGISLSGDEFFYPNPLASKGGYRRSKWFGTSCCPVNDVRFIPQVPSMAYASKKGVVYWNLFVEGMAKVSLADSSPVVVSLDQKTEYPWSGKAELSLAPLVETGMASFALKVRIPGWAKGRPVPSDLYVQTSPSSASDVSLSVNGERVAAKVGDDGYVTIERKWKVGDKVVLDLPMPVKRIRANEKVAADRGRLAVERGPVVYCAEGFDNGGKAYGAVLPADAIFEDTTISIGDKTFPALKASNGLVLIPYFLWGNREPGNELQTWFSIDVQ